MLIGVLGGGQLGRMLALAGIPLGLRFRFLDPNPDSPAAAVGDLIVGAFDDPGAIDRFAAGLDVATFEFENVPAASVCRLEGSIPVFPSAAALEIAQDRITEKHAFVSAGMRVHDFAGAETGPEVAAAASRLGVPVVVKTRRMGYDGRGQMIFRREQDGAGAWEALGRVGLIVERYVPFDRELSLVACRSRAGEFACYPLVENVHREGILRVTRAPAMNISSAMQVECEGHARGLMERLEYVGVLAIEFFEYRGGLLVNEMAPRVHNSGHWTIEGAMTSQFENHCRAVAGLPLGSCAARGASVMVNLIGGIPEATDVLKIPGAHLHLYGKSARAGRKVGHVTVTGESREAIAASVAQVEAWAAG